MIFSCRPCPLGLRAQTAWVHILVLLLTSSVTLGKICPLSLGLLQLEREGCEDQL